MPKKLKMRIQTYYEPADQGPDRIIDHVLRNDFAMVDEILERDPSQINARLPVLHITPLMAAAGRGMEDMVAHLVQKPGIDFDLVDCEERSALEHGRVFPEIVSKIMRARFPNLKWREPRLQML